MRAKIRLQEIANQIENVNVVADIGADHGYLTKMLIEQGRAKHVIATDISKPSLQKTEMLAKRFGFENKIETRVGDGLDPIFKEDKVEVCVIAGMGGYEIMKIIDNSPINIDTFILAPQHDIIELKKYLNNHNFDIDFDIIILDKGKFYNIIKCRRVEYQSQINEFNLYFGKDNFTNPLSDIDKYIDKYLAKFRDIKAKQKSPNDKIDEQIRLFEKAKKELRYE